MVAMATTVAMTGITGSITAVAAADASRTTTRDTGAGARAPAPVTFQAPVRARRAAPILRAIAKAARAAPSFAMPLPAMS